MHPSVAETAALAARVVGLDIAGVDMVLEDISKPMREQRAAVIEVNASPGLLAHIKPADGESRPRWARPSSTTCSMAVAMAVSPSLA